MTTPELRLQSHHWFVELGYVDGNGIGRWDGTKESVEVASRMEADALRDQWVSEGKLSITQWGEYRPPYPYGVFRIRSEWRDMPLSPAVLAELPEVQAMVAAERERCAAEMDLAAHIMSLHGTDLEMRAYQNAAAAIREGRK